MKIKHKYGAKPTIKNGFRFDSKIEAKIATFFEILQRKGVVIFFLKQVPFHLPGKTKFVCDFQVFWSNGEVSFVDAKGVETAMFVLKKKQTECLYPVEIEIWKIVPNIEKFLRDYEERDKKMGNRVLSC